jgi:hypothetical protein
VSHTDKTTSPLQDPRRRNADVGRIARCLVQSLRYPHIANKTAVRRPNWGRALILRRLKIIEYTQYSVIGRYQIHQRRHITHMASYYNMLHQTFIWINGRALHQMETQLLE